MVLIVPAVSSLATLAARRQETRAGDVVAHHMALSAPAMGAVRELFNTEQTIRTATSAVAAVLTVLAAYTWPAELQRVYEAVWALPSRGGRQLCPERS